MELGHWFSIFLNNIAWTQWSPMHSRLLWASAEVGGFDATDGDWAWVSNLVHVMWHECWWPHDWYRLLGERISWKNRLAQVTTIEQEHLFLLMANSLGVLTFDKQKQEIRCLAASCQVALKRGRDGQTGSHWHSFYSGHGRAKASVHLFICSFWGSDFWLVQPPFSCWSIGKDEAISDLSQQNAGRKTSIHINPWKTSVWLGDWWREPFMEPFGSLYSIFPQWFFNGERRSDSGWLRTPAVGIWIGQIFIPATNPMTCPQYDGWSAAIPSQDGLLRWARQLLQVPKVPMMIDPIWSEEQLIPLRKWPMTSLSFWTWGCYTPFSSIFEVF